MGNGFGQALAQVVPGAHEGTPWLRIGRGPTLRRLFGAYENGDIWAAYRRLRRVDEEKSGYISYDELKQVILLAEFHLLFVWDLYNQQNQLIEGRELLTLICVFSSAKLTDKAKFLMTLFDASSSGSLTGAEIAQICVAVLGVLSKCTSVAVRSRSVTTGLKNEFPTLLAEYQQVLKQSGAEATFSKERFIGRAEVERLLLTIEAQYQQLPIGEPAPLGAVAPPAPDWGASEERAEQLTFGGKPKELPAAGGGASAARALVHSRSRPRLTEAELAHFALMGGMGDEDGEEDELSDGKPITRSMTSTLRRSLTEPARCWLVIHGVTLREVSKDIGGFRYLFTKSAAAALGVPPACVEVVDVTGGSVVIEFLVYGIDARGNSQSSKALVLALSRQLSSSDSVLKTGKFGRFAASAELLTGETRKRAAPPVTGLGDGTAPLYCDHEAQCTDLALTLEEVLGQLEAARARAAEAEAAHRGALEELRRRDVAIAELREEEKRREEREKAKRRQEEDRRLQDLLEEERQAEQRTPQSEERPSDAARGVEEEGPPSEPQGVGEAASEPQGAGEEEPVNLDDFAREMELLRLQLQQRDPEEQEQDQESSTSRPAEELGQVRRAAVEQAMHIATGEALNDTTADIQVSGRDAAEPEAEL